MDSKPPPANSLSLVILIAVLVVLLSLSCLFSISESSLLAMNKLRLRIKRQNKDPAATRLSDLLQKKEQVINTLLFANDLVNILISSILAAVFMSLFGTGGVAYATFIATISLLIFGEITPKTISTRHADAIAYALSNFIFITFQILRLPSFLLTSFANCVLRLFGINVKKTEVSYTEEEIRTFVDFSGEEGAIAEGENVIMRRIFRFTDLEAQSVMTPRTEIVALPSDASYEKILETAKATNFSRFPVYRETIDHIVGVLYIKDLFAFAQKNGRADSFEITQFMRKPLFILGSKKMSSVRESMHESHQTLAIVVDEYSGTDGIITQEDIVQKVFGKSDDIFEDSIFENKSAQNTNDFYVEGAALLSEINEKLSTDFSSEINETLGGWLEEKLDRLPVEGDVVSYDNWQFTIENMEMRRIGKIRIQNMEQIADRGDGKWQTQL